MGSKYVGITLIKEKSSLRWARGVRGRGVVSLKKER
jgi:hypothetical protein